LPGLVVAGVGREYTFGQLVRIAWGHLRRHWKRALGYGLVLGLLWGGTILTVSVGEFWIRYLWRNSLPGSPVVQFAVVWGTAILSSVLRAVCELVVFQGYLWCVVRGFDRERLAWGDIWRLWRAPWRRIFFAFVLAMTPVAALVPVVRAAVQHGLVGLSGLASLPTSMAEYAIVTSLEGVMMGVFGAVILSLTLFVSPLILSSDWPRLASVWRDHFAILRGRPRQVLAVVAVFAGLAQTIFTVYAITLAFMSQAFSSPYAAVAGMFCTYVATLGLMGACDFVLQFLVATVFRAACGMSLERPPQLPSPGLTAPDAALRPAHRNPA